MSKTKIHTCWNCGKSPARKGSVICTSCEDATTVDEFDKNKTKLGEFVHDNLFDFFNQMNSLKEKGF